LDFNLIWDLAHHLLTADNLLISILSQKIKKNKKKINGFRNRMGFWDRMGFS